MRLLYGAVDVLFGGRTVLLKFDNSLMIGKKRDGGRLIKFGYVRGVLIRSNISNYSLFYFFDKLIFNFRKIKTLKGMIK